MSVLSRHYNFTPEHKAALRDYSDDSSKINSHLWDKHEGITHPSSDEVHKPQVEAIDKALSSHKTPHNMTVYSGISYDPTHRMNHGEVVHPAYLSTSLHHNIARGFTEHHRSGRHILAIHVPEGHPGAYIGHVSHVPREDEFILPRGTKLKHVKTETHKFSSFLKGSSVYNTHHMEIIK